MSVISQIKHKIKEIEELLEKLEQPPVQCGVTLGNAGPYNHEVSTSLRRILREFMTLSEERVATIMDSTTGNIVDKSTLLSELRDRTLWIQSGSERSTLRII